MAGYTISIWLNDEEQRQLDKRMTELRRLAVEQDIDPNWDVERVLIVCALVGLQTWLAEDPATAMQQPTADFVDSFVEEPVPLWLQRLRAD